MLYHEPNRIVSILSIASVDDFSFFVIPV